jgi:hypothetical protein
MILLFLLAQAVRPHLVSGSILQYVVPLIYSSPYDAIDPTSKSRCSRWHLCTEMMGERG